ncbi:GH25 family lysozyme [Sphingomonas melonis]|jgi:lysozyme|uniref:Lysozyme n=1 Tax=Sphingomonas melonis TaxID=152682 RepID=A0A7Y9FQK9_9SPHN|nr:GH25 family lysozyme [Sphingomonas melonis]NYD91498.1 lysozyme [Sphingomonas melonis]
MASFLLKAAGVLVAAGAIGIGGWSFATGWHPAASQYPLQGLDLAENPGSIEWGTVRARGADFAYLIATSGKDRRDPGFEANWAAVPDAGLRRGAVHLYSLCQPGAAQANAFNAFVPRTADALPAAVDVAYRPDCTARPERAELVRELRTFITMVETHTRKPVLLRLSKPVDSDYEISAAIERPVWAIANLFPPAYAARAWRMWRASDIRRIDGIEGPVNWDVVAP